MNKYISFAVLVLLVALARLIPHPPNFSPLLAVAIFAGAMSPSRWIGYVIPVLALVLSDLYFGAHDLMPVVAFCLIVCTAMGELTERWSLRASTGRRFGAFAATGLLASVFFFLVTNFAVWKTAKIYPLTSEGLWTSYVMALPFFQNQILSTWLFSLALFGVWATVPAAESRNTKFLQS
jgi:hypothetical protein